MHDTKNINLEAWTKVEKARDKNRPNSLEYIQEIFDSIHEFHGDRAYGEDQSVFGGIASLDGISVTIIGIVKGKSVEENIERNFGMVHPEGYRKALRLMKQAEKFKRPIVTFIDTPGAYPGIGAEERGQGHAIATNLYEMMELSVPSIAIILGEAGSGGALALAVTNQVWMLENSIYSILSPEGFASILYKDVSKAKEIVDIMKITSHDLKALGIIDRIIEEGSFEETALNLKRNLIEELTVMRKWKPKKIKSQRFERFRSMGDIIHEN